MEYALNQLTLTSFLGPHSGDTALSSTTVISRGWGMFGKRFPFAQFLVISVNPVVIVAMFSGSPLRH